MFIRRDEILNQADEINRKRKAGMDTRLEEQRLRDFFSQK